MFGVMMLGFYISAVLSYKYRKTVEWMEHITPQNYSRFTSPGYQQYEENVAAGISDIKLNPTYVHLSFKPQFLVSLEPKTMDFVIECVMDIWWKDHRLVIPKESMTTTSRVIELPHEISAKLWTPRLVLANCKGCHRELIDVSEQRVLLYKNNKAVLVKVAGSLTFTCDIDLTNYPFDSQKCSVVILKNNWRVSVPFAAYSFNITIKHQRVIAPPEFSLNSVNFNNCTNSTDVNEECIKYVFHLRRQVTHYIMLVFIPSMLIVVLSWISFWLDPDMAAPRVALGLTSLLTLATQFNNAQKDLPPVATIKALDIWMFVCMLMVFYSLIEFAIVNYWNRRHKFRNIRNTAKIRNNKVFPRFHGRHRFRTSLFSTSKTEYNGDKPTASNVDVFARITFPLIFAIFNIIYWTYFIYNEAN